KVNAIGLTSNGYLISPHPGLSRRIESLPVPARGIFQRLPVSLLRCCSLLVPPEPISVAADAVAAMRLQGGRSRRPRLFSVAA
ncbi:MAG: hypothetical protein ACKOEO_00255, partial [Planctomycetaceae bacterium]